MKNPFFENLFQNYHIKEQEFNRLISKQFDETNSMYGDGYVRAEEFSDKKLRIINESLENKTANNYDYIYDIDRINFVLDENKIIVKIFKG